MESWSAASGPDLESRPFITQGKLRRVYSDHSLAAQLNHQARHSRQTTVAGFLLLTLNSLGVIYGDIGTSPLYVFSAIFNGLPGFQEEDILGAMCLIIYSLVFVVFLKYIVFVLEAHRNGEGGIFALVSLIPPDHESETEQMESSPQHNRIKAVCTFASFIGASLVLGDGAITPAISVLSAVEGIDVALPWTAVYVIPITCGILVALFMIQRFGTHVVGIVFGPIMLVWFFSIGAVGFLNLVASPHCLRAFNPMYGVLFFTRNGATGWVLLGAVVLAVTGVEALYADLGHFGQWPVRLSWSVVVFPALVMNYLGQVGVLITHPEYVSNVFFMSLPESIYWPMLVLATLAAMIASQAMISGTFSLISQAIALDFFPPLRVVHTSSSVYGQVYIPAINYPLMLATVLLVITFRSSTGMANAYGFAVTSTVSITTVLFMAMAILRWKISAWVVVPLGSVFLFVDLVFFSANAIKIFGGGWVPMLFGMIFIVLMCVWKMGRTDVIQAQQSQAQTFESTLGINANLIRTPGTGVFFSAGGESLPMVLLAYSQFSNSLPRKVVLFQSEFVEVPHVPSELKMSGTVLGDKNSGINLVVARFGYMETGQSAEVLLEEARDKGLVEVDNTVDLCRFFILRETLVPAEGAKAWWLKRWRLQLYNLLAHGFTTNPSVKMLEIPPEATVELGCKLMIS